MKIGVISMQHHTYRVDLYSKLKHIVLYHTCIMDEEGICFLEWILRNDREAILHKLEAITRRQDAACPVKYNQNGV